MSKQQKDFYPDEFKEFIVTGTLPSGKPFKPIKCCGGYTGWRQAECINLYSGRIWGKLKSGKRVLLKSVNC